MLKETLFELFGDFDTVHDLDELGHAHFSTDDFTIIVHGQHGFYLVSVDLIDTFNKVSQCPIHFEMSDYKPLSKRKKNRIREDAGGFFGGMDGFDDLSSDIRRSFYNH